VPPGRSLFLLTAAVLCLACHGAAPGSLTATASDRWMRTYTIADAGELQIIGSNGSVDVQGVDGNTITVEAERIARAATDAAAREVVPRINIREEASPDKVLVQTEGLGGIVIGVDVSVNYHVSMPRQARLRVRAANGPITVSNVSGGIVLSGVNGTITATGIGGGVDARSVNRDLKIDLASFGRDPVELRSTNGSVDVALPRDASASLLLNVTNGAIDVGHLPFEPFGEQTKRRVRGRLNAGGSPLEVTVVNGGIRLHARP
jgi:hypothetical protein